MDAWESFVSTGASHAVVYCIGVLLGWLARDRFIASERTPSHRAPVRPPKPVEVVDDPTYQLAPKTPAAPEPVAPRQVIVPISVEVVAVPEGSAEINRTNYLNGLGEIIAIRYEVVATYRPPAPGRTRAVVDTNPVNVIRTDPIILGAPKPKRGRHAA